MKKVALTMLTLVLALAVAGIGYAKWSDTLTVSGAVTTGKLEIKFDSKYRNDLGLDPCEAGTWTIPQQGGEPTWVGQTYTKDVGCVSAGFDGHSATIALNNAYPSYWASVLWDVKNTGDIPVKLDSVKLTELSFMDSPVWTGSITLNIGTRYYVDVGPDHANIDQDLNPGDDFSFMLSSHECEQIDAGDKGYIDVTVHVEQDALQEKTYDFTLKFEFVQWNEGLPCPTG